MKNAFFRRSALAFSVILMASSFAAGAAHAAPPGESLGLAEAPSATAFAADSEPGSGGATFSSNSQSARPMALPDSDAEAASVSAVPEPQTWALLAAGVGVVLLLLRGRRKPD